MRRAVRVVCRPPATPGFALAGLAPVEAPGDEAAAAILRRLLADPEIGVILIEEPLHGGLPQELRRDLDRRPLPMILPFPAPAWAAPAGGPEAAFVEILRQAIGYRVRLP
jgi:vacuolar-type H+-ATPase subunit F/Vma7